MSYAEFPQKQRRQQESAGKQRQEDQYLLRPASQQVQERVILYQGIGDDKGGKEQELLPVDSHRVLPVLSGAVRKYIHELQAIQGEEAQGGVNQEQSGENCGSADEHEKNRHNPGEIPADFAFRNSVSEHHNGLEHSSDPGQLEFAPQHLQDFVAGPHQNSVKLCLPHHAGERIESPGKHFRQGKFQQHDGKAQQHLAVGKSLHRMESVKHEENAQEHGEGDQELSHGSEKKGHFILHGGSDIYGDIMHVQAN